MLINHAVTQEYYLVNNYMGNRNKSVPCAWSQTQCQLFALPNLFWGKWKRLDVTLDLGIVFFLCVRTHVCCCMFCWQASVLQVPCFSALGQGDDAIGFVQSCWQSTHADICSLPASQTNLNQEIYTHSITRAHAHAWWNIQLVFPMHAHTQPHTNTFNHIERHWWCLVSRNITQWYTNTHMQMWSLHWTTVR